MVAIIANFECQRQVAATLAATAGLVGIAGKVFLRRGVCLWQ